jgi:hypothetical protein
MAATVFYREVWGIYLPDFRAFDPWLHFSTRAGDECQCHKPCFVHHSQSVESYFGCGSTMLFSGCSHFPARWSITAFASARAMFNASS